MKHIELTKGYKTLVDDDTYEIYKLQKMFVSGGKGKMYAAFGHRSLKLHRVIMGSPIGMTIDHINGDSLDNRKSNLRVCSQANNTKSVNRKLVGFSGFKGVFKCGDKFRAHICFNYKRIWLGTFTTAIEAAKVYNKKAEELFGEFAILNIIGDSHD